MKKSDKFRIYEKREGGIMVQNCRGSQKQEEEKKRRRKREGKNFHYVQEDKTYNHALKIDIEPEWFDNENNFHIHSHVELMHA